MTDEILEVETPEEVTEVIETPEQPEVNYQELYESEKKAREEAEEQKSKWASRFKKTKSKNQEQRENGDIVTIDQVAEVAQEMLKIEKFKDTLGESFTEVQKIADEKGIDLETAKDLHAFYQTRDEGLQAQEQAGATGMTGRPVSTPMNGRTDKQQVIDDKWDSL